MIMEKLVMGKHVAIGVYGRMRRDLGLVGIAGEILGM